MTYHIRVRPTALVVENECILLVEYKDEHGVHYNLPGGGAEPGETLVEGVQREMMEETMSEVYVGPVAMVYECAPHKQSGDYPDSPHSLNVIFECSLKQGVIPRLPEKTDPHQSAVKWIPITQLDSILLFPNIKDKIKEYVKSRRNIQLIEDHQLDRYFSI